MKSITECLRCLRAPRCLTYLSLLQRLGQVLLQVVDIFYPGGDAHETVGDAERGATVWRDRRMRHRRRMRNQRFDASQAFRKRMQLDVVQHRSRGLERTHLERQHPAETVHLSLRQLVMWM